MDVGFIRRRITQLRISRGISEYKMSLDLGHSRSYIQSIASGRALPSLAEFLYICEYLGVSPKDFFDEEIDEPIAVAGATEKLKRMSESDIKLLTEIIERLEK